MKMIIRWVLVLAILMSLSAVVSAQDDGMMMEGLDVIVTLEATPLAEGAGLAGVTGRAHFTSDAGFLHVTLEPNGAELPEGSVLEGWVVDAGLDGGPGETNVTDDDEAFGPGFGNEAFDAAVESAPYALSTGVLTATDMGTWEVEFQIEGYYFSPYDAVVITLESDGNSIDGFDPRPGTPVFTGAVATGEPAGDMMMDDEMADDEMADDEMADDEMADDEMADDEMADDEMADGEMADDEMMDDEMADDEMADDEMMDDEMADDEMADDEMMDDGMMDDMGMSTEVTLATTPLAEGAGLADITGVSTVWVDSATIEITVNLNGATLPEGSVLEGWVVDAGLEGGPGETNVTDDDEAFGTPFGNEAFDAAVESAPYALSTGNLVDNGDGTLTATLYFPGYNFSPYDAVVITLESDGNTAAGFDPRPGTPVLSGPISADM